MDLLSSYFSKKINRCQFQRSCTNRLQVYKIGFGAKSPLTWSPIGIKETTKTGANTLTHLPKCQWCIEGLLNNVGKDIHISNL